jgi:hypothetical protein
MTSGQRAKRSVRLRVALGFVVRALIAVVPIVWIVTRFDVASAFDQALDVGLGPVAMSSTAQLVCIVLGAVRCRVLLRAYGADPLPGIAELVRGIMVGLYLNLIPGAVAGELVRAHRVSPTVGGLPTALMVMFLDRLGGLMGLVLIGAGTMLFGAQQSGSAGQWALATAAVLGAFGAALVVAAAIHGGPSSRLARLPWIGGSISSLRRPERPWELGLALVLSVGTQASMMVSVLALVVGIAPAASLSAAIQVAPVVVLLTFVPITPGGVGQREAVFIELWGRAGVSAQQAIAASVASFGVSIAFAASGGLMMLAERVGVFGPAISATPPRPPNE